MYINFQSWIRWRAKASDVFLVCILCLSIKKEVDDSPITVGEHWYNAYLIFNKKKSIIIQYLKNNAMAHHICFWLVFIILFDAEK